MLLTPMLIAAVALMSALSCSSAASPSLMQRIRDSANLTKFSKLLSDAGLDAKLNSSEPCSPGGATSCYLVFAPSDAAFAKLAGGLSSVNQTMLAYQHIATVDTGKKILLSSWSELDRPAAVGRDVGLGQVRIFSARGSVLFWQAKQTSGKWSYHVNNAAVNLMLSNQDAANGVLHVLDDLALPLSRDLSLAALFTLNEDDSFVKQMSVGRTLRTFKDWMSTDPEFKQGYDALLAGSAVRTAFLPTDAAWASVPQPVLDAMNATARRDLLTAHLAPDVALFTGWLAPDRQIVEFATGQSERKTVGRLVVRGGAGGAAFVSVGGVFTRLFGEGSNLALRDAVLHAVDRVLAVPPRHRNLSEAARSLAPAFHELCLTSEACKGALAGSEDGRPWTLFAPIDVAGLAAAADLERTLLLHFVPRQLIPKYNMTDSLLVSGANKSGQIRFRPSSDFTKVWVESRLAGRGFVRSELAAFDESTQGGDLVHTVLTPLGRPALSLREAAAQLPQLSEAAALFQACAPKLLAAAAAAGESANRSGSVVTAFLPSNEALTELSPLLQLQRGVNATSNGTAAALQEVLCSFVVPGESILADGLADGAFATYRTGAGNGTLTVKFLFGTTDRALSLQLLPQKLVATASVSRGQYQCSDGILYILDTIGPDNGRDHKSQMIVQKGAVSMATSACSAASLIAVVAGTVLARRLLFN